MVRVRFLDGSQATYDADTWVRRGENEAELTKEGKRVAAVRHFSSVETFHGDS